MSELWTSTAWLLSVLCVFGCMWALASVSRCQVELVKAVEKAAHAQSLAFDALRRSEQADCYAARALNEAVTARDSAQRAVIEIEAQKKATHTIQMVPVDDIADKALNKGLDGIDDVSFETMHEIHENSEPLG